jgi:hypothetical protein
MDNTNATQNANIIRAIRVAYRVAWMLPADSAVEYVRTLAAAWRECDREGCATTLGMIQWELSNVEGAWSAWWELKLAAGRAAMGA